MDDLISRQAAIDFVDAGHLVNPNEPRWSDNEVVNFLKSRPSAQPEIIRERTKNIRQICEEIIKWGKLVLKYNGKDIVFVPCNDSEDHNNKE